MKRYHYYIGWDISKLTLNYCLRQMDGKIIEQGEIKNSRSVIKAFFKAKLKEYSVDAGQIFCLIEHTGLFINRLVHESHTAGLATCVEDALKINKAYRRQMDKSDPEDARIISEYAMEKAYRLKKWSPPKTVESELKGLHRRRRSLVKNVHSMTTSLNNSIEWDAFDLDVEIAGEINTGIAYIKALIEKIDKKIEKVILANEELAVIYHRTRSVSGCGAKNTIVILLETWFFHKITTAKSCANYAGLRPITKSSGTSLNKKKRTSKQVNIALKTAFHQGAFSIAYSQPHFIEYRLRKEAEGKSHLQIINAIRNKMCRAIYACHRDEVMYDKNIQSNVA
jgi:transposase